MGVVVVKLTGTHEDSNLLKVLFGYMRLDMIEVFKPSSHGSVKIVHLDQGLDPTSSSKARKQHTLVNNRLVEFMYHSA